MEHQSERHDHKAKVFAALLLTAVLFGVLFFSNFFISEHLHHDCTGENCPVCAEIQHAQSLIDEIGGAVTAPVIVTGFTALILAVIISLISFIPEHTLISEKVRLND